MHMYSMKVSRIARWHLEPGYISTITATTTIPIVVQ